MAHYKVSLFRDPNHFGAVVLRLAFALLFILVAVKKFRMGIGEFTNAMVLNPDTLLAQDVPAWILQVYGYSIAWIELAAGVLLLFDRYTKVAYTVVAFSYISFILGQMYNGNTAKIGTEYMPSLLAVVAAYYMHEKDEPRRK